MTERDLTSLDAAFNLPDEAVTNPELRMLYEVLVHRMREEAKHVPMNTVQTLLIERIAANYVYMRQREASGLNHITPQHMKELNTFWLSMTAQFQKNLTKATSAEDRERILYEVGGALKGMLEKIEDKSVRKQMAELIANEFKSAGIG